MIKKINKAVMWIETFLGTIGVIAMFVLILCGCVRRYFFNSPIKWVEEVTNLLLIWCGYLAMCYTAGNDSHVRIDLLTMKMPKAVKNIWNSVLMLISSVTFALLMGPAIEAIKYQITTPALNLSLKVLFTIMPISCGLIIFHSLCNALELILDLFRKEENA